MLDATAKQKIVRETIKKMVDESESTRHYANIAKVIQQLQKSIAEHGSIVTDNKRILNEYYKLMGIADTNNVKYEKQTTSLQNTIKQFGSIDDLIETLDSEIKRIGSKDWTGKDGRTYSKTELVSLIEPLIPRVKIDEEKIVKDVLSQIKVENGKDAIIDEDALIEKLVQYIKDKKPIDISHIRNWQSLKSKKSDMNDMRWHGGGATLVAGSNVTLTLNSNGTTTVAATGGGSFTILAVTGTIDDSNVTFTVASLPSILIINGGMYQTTGGAITWSYLAGTLTLSTAVGLNGTIFAIE